MAVLTLALLTQFSQSAFCSSDPKAIQCVENFLSKYDGIRGYQTTMIKKEWDQDGNPLHDEKVSLTFEKPVRVIFKYLNDGTTGIRNNGMTVEYDGTDELKVSLGKPKFFGFLTNTVASAVIGDRMPFYDSKVLDDEIFTLNRAGFDYLAFALRKHLPSLRTSEVGGLSMQGEGGCRIRYVAHLNGEDEIELRPTDSISLLEERYATLAYLIFQNNRNKFSSFSELFSRKNKVNIKIPRSFMDFELVLDQKTSLPEKFSLFRNEKIIGEYQFSETQVRER